MFWPEISLGKTARIIFCHSQTLIHFSRYRPARGIAHERLVIESILLEQPQAGEFVLHQYIFDPLIGGIRIPKCLVTYPVSLGDCSGRVDASRRELIGHELFRKLAVRSAKKDASSNVEQDENHCRRNGDRPWT